MRIFYLRATITAKSATPAQVAETVFFRWFCVPVAFLIARKMIKERLLSDRPDNPANFAHIVANRMFLKRSSPRAELRHARAYLSSHATL